MISFQNIKTVVALKQQSATNGATLTSDNIDTKGYNYLSLLVHGSTSDNVTNNPATLKLQESDSTAATDFADITAFVGDGAGGFTIPNSPTATTTALFAKLDVDLRGRKRYIRLLVSPVTTQTFSALGLLGRPDESPVGATEENAAVVVRG